MVGRLLLSVDGKLRGDPAKTGAWTMEANSSLELLRLQARCGWSIHIGKEASTVRRTLPECMQLKSAEDKPISLYPLFEI